MVPRREGEGRQGARYSRAESNHDEDRAELTHDMLGRTVLDSLSENDEACNELLMELADYLPKRYPTLFRREGNDVIVNLVTGERHIHLSSKRGTDALRIVSR